MPQEQENSGQQEKIAAHVEEQAPPQGQDEPAKDNGRMQRNWTMPQEVLDACAGKENGSSCSYAADQGSVTGTCRAGRDGQIMCASERAMPRGNSTRSFPEASQACKGKDVGDHCSFKINDADAGGTCAKRGEELTCAPTGGPGRGERPNDAPR